MRKQPNNLLPDDVADLAASIGLRIDRRNVTRALTDVPLPGVVPPPRRGVPWTIPRSSLVQVFAVCLRRRALRELAPQRLRPQPLECYEAEAARRLLRVPELAPLVPRALVTRLREQDAAARERRRRQREEEERQARRAREAALARERQRREAEARREAAWREQQRARELERQLERAYSVCKRLAYRDYRADCARRGVDGPIGRDWPDRHPQFLADWPMARPSWWRPPPGLFEAVAAEPACRPYGYQEPDWRRWVPPYVPGQPWPWRSDVSSSSPVAKADA